MPYSIVTKDNITINNIPDGVAPDSQELKDRVASIRAGRTTAAPEEEPGLLTELGRGLVRGTGTMVSGFARPVEELPQIAATATPLALIPSVREKLQEAVRPTEEAWKEKVAPFTEWLKEAGADISGTVSPRVTPRLAEAWEQGGAPGALKSLAVTVSESATPMLAGALTGYVTKNPAAAMSVMGLTGAPQTYTGIREMQDQTGQEDIGAAVAGTAVVTALDLLSGAGKAATNLGRDAIKEAFEQGLRSATKEVLKTGAEETGTEALQNVIEQVAGGADPTTKQSLLDTLEAGLAGTVGGTAFGGVSEGVNKLAAVRARNAAAELPALHTININVPDTNRTAPLDIISAPDPDGFVIARTPENFIRRVNIDELDQMQAAPRGAAPRSVRDALQKALGKEEALGPEVSEPADVDYEAVRDSLFNAAGPSVPYKATSWVNALERKVSGSLGTNTPESLRSAMEYIDQQEAVANAGVEFDEDVATPYLGALSEARRIIGEAASRLPAIEETDDGVAGPYVRGGEPSVPSPDGAGAVRGAPEETEAAAPPGVEAAGRLAEPDIGRTGAGEPPLGAEQAPPAAPTLEEDLGAFLDFISRGANKDTPTPQALVDRIATGLTSIYVSGKTPQTELPEALQPAVEAFFSNHAADISAVAERLQQQGAEQAPPAAPEGADRPVVGFTTAKGSTYTIGDKGITTRNKAPRPEHPGAKERGPQPPSEATFYVPEDLVDNFSLIQAEGKYPLRIERRGEYAALAYAAGPEEGKILRGTPTKISDTPAIGLIPVETWSAGRRVHFGNKIVSLDYAPAAPEVTPEVEQPAAFNLDTYEPDLTPLREGKTVKDRIPVAEGLVADAVTQMGFDPEADLTIADTVIPQAARQLAQRANKPDLNFASIVRDKLEEHGYEVPTPPEVEAAAPAAAAPTPTPTAAAPAAVAPTPTPTAAAPAAVAPTPTPTAAAPAAAAAAPTPAAPTPPTPPTPAAAMPPTPAASSVPAEPLRAANKWVRRLADDFNMGAELDNWAQKSLGVSVLPEKYSTARRLELFRSATAGKIREIQRNYEDPIIRAMKRLNVDSADLHLFLWARQARERNPEIALVNADFPDGGIGMLTAQADAILQQFKREGKLANLNRIAHMADKLVDFTLGQKVRAGMITAKEAKALRTKYKHYMPLKGFAVDGDLLTAIPGLKYKEQRAQDIETARNASVPLTSVREFRRAYGRNTVPFHPLYNLFQDAEEAVRRNMRNDAARPLIRLWKKDPSLLDGIADVYIDKAKPKQVLISRGVPGGKYTPVSDMMREYYANPGKYLMVKDKGVVFYVEFKETEAGQALQRMYKNLEPEVLEGVLGHVATVNNFLKGMLTYKNPIYQLSVAPLRDISAAIATAMHNQNLKGSPAYKKNLALHTAKHVFNYTTWTTLFRYVFGKAPMRTKTEKLLQQMIREGGAPLHARLMQAQENARVGMGGIRALRSVDFSSPKDMSMRVWQGLNQVLDGIGDIMDMSARFATYRAATELGITPTDAASLALDSSLNLTRRGELARKLDLIIPFFGAGVEGSRKMWRFSKNPKTLLKVGGALVAYGIIESMINSANSGDSDDDGREDYLDQDLNAKRRLSRAVLFYGDQPEDYVSIPIDPMLGFFKYVGNRVGDIMTGNTTTPDAAASIVEAGVDIGGAAVSVLSPMRVPGTDAQAVLVAATPLVGKPVMEAAVNRNFFNSPIYKERGFNMAPASELGRETTGEGWKILARAINQFTGGSVAVQGGLDAQPEFYRHIVESWLGGPYQLVKQVAALPNAEDASDIPFVKTFVGAGSEFVPQSKYYQNTDVIRQIMNRASKLTPEQAREVVDKYALETNPLILEAYEEVEKRLDELNEMQKEAIAVAREGSSPDEDIKLVMDYILAEKSKYYSAFNRLYNDAKRGE